MPGLGTAVNVATVVAGTAAGVVLGDRLPARMRTTVLHVVGLMTLVIGVREAATTRNVVFPLVSLILGAVAGEALRIEERLNGLGERLRRWGS